MNLHAAAAYPRHISTQGYVLAFRDMSDASSYFDIAVLDDRIEIHGIGRTGAIEVWGRGTNRVIESCRVYGIADPTFTEASGAVTVTFKAAVVAGARDLVPGRH